MIATQTQTTVHYIGTAAAAPAAAPVCHPPLNDRPFNFSGPPPPPPDQRSNAAESTPQSLTSTRRLCRKVHRRARVPFFPVHCTVLLSVNETPLCGFIFKGRFDSVPKNKKQHWPRFYKNKQTNKTNPIIHLAFFPCTALA